MAEKGIVELEGGDGDGEGRGGREEWEGEEGRGKGREGGAFRQIKIYDYTLPSAFASVVMKFHFLTPSLTLNWTYLYNSVYK